MLSCWCYNTVLDYCTSISGRGSCDELLSGFGRLYSIFVKASIRSVLLIHTEEMDSNLLFRVGLWCS